jgi:GTPase SAR1 family protein
MERRCILMEITRGRIQKAQKVVIYGPEGVGKSTLANKFPNPVYIDTEDSTVEMDVARLPKPSSFTMILEEIKYIKQNKPCSTLILDTADWAEQLAITELCSKRSVQGIEDLGYGKGYVYLAEDFGKLLNALQELVDIGINVVVTAHAQMRKFEQPDEMGAYDRWELKLQKKTAPLLKEWADMVLFCNYKTIVINVDNQGATKGKNKAQGGVKRIMHTEHHACWDAKNRHGLPAELDMDYTKIAHCIPDLIAGKQAEKTSNEKQAEPKMEPKTEPKEPKQEAPKVEPAPQQLDEYAGIPKALADLMKEYMVSRAEIEGVVAQRGYYSKGTPIENYDEGFVNGVLVGAWAQVYDMIKKHKQSNGDFVKVEEPEEIPFDTVQ